MFRYEKIYNILKTTTPTNGELAEMIYGYDDGDNNGYRQNIRAFLIDIRRRYNVQIIADQNGRYRMSIPQYSYQDKQFEPRGKLGRPRHYAA